MGFRDGNDDGCMLATTPRSSRRSRSKSASDKLELSKFDAAHLSIIPDALRQLSSREKETLRAREQDNEGQLQSKRQPNGSHGQSAPSASHHFRPVPFQIKSELDNFFGQTSGQKRELALRTRGEDGHLWYDGIGEWGAAFARSTHADWGVLFRARGVCTSALYTEQPF